MRILNGICLIGTIEATWPPLSDERRLAARLFLPK